MTGGWSDEVRARLEETASDWERLPVHGEYAPEAQLGRDIRAALERVEQQREAAGNLLARIHRDGGHHTEEVGFRQSCLDAEQQHGFTCQTMQQEIDRQTKRAEAAEAENARLRVALEQIEQATEGIPEQNCAIANRLARVALAPEVK